MSWDQLSAVLIFPIIINKFTNFIGNNIFKRYNFNIIKNKFPIKDVLFTYPICNDVSKDMDVRF